MIEYNLTVCIRSYTCEFVQKVGGNKSEVDDVCDEPIESIRQDENFSKLISCQIVDNTLINTFINILF